MKSPSAFLRYTLFSLSGDNTTHLYIMSVTWHWPFRGHSDFTLHYMTSILWHLCWSFFCCEILSCSTCFACKNSIFIYIYINFLPFTFILYQAFVNVLVLSSWVTIPAATCHKISTFVTTFLQCFKGTLMQIWKSANMFVIIWK